MTDRTQARINWGTGLAVILAGCFVSVAQIGSGISVVGSLVVIGVLLVGSVVTVYSPSVIHRFDGETRYTVVCRLASGIELCLVLTALALLIGPGPLSLKTCGAVLAILAVGLSILLAWLFISPSFLEVLEEVFGANGGERYGANRADAIAENGTTDV